MQTRYAPIATQITLPSFMSVVGGQCQGEADQRAEKMPRAEQHDHGDEEVVGGLHYATTLFRCIFWSNRQIISP